VSDERDVVLAPWCDALADAVEQEIARWAPVPDLADVLARAREQDPSAVPESWHGEDDDEVVPLSRRRALSQERIDPGLAMFAAALHRSVEGELRERGLAEIPAPTRARRPVRTYAAAALALAAVLVAAFVAVPRIVAERSADDRVTPSAARTVKRVTPASSWRIAPPPAVPRTPARVEPAPATPPSPTVAPTIAPARPDRRVELDALARDAESLWRAGDLAGAERVLRRIVATAGKSARAELAYGDLFALARQRRGAAGPVAEWKAYLKRFPRGRFAEDARAGLCKHVGAADDARTCWADYLRHHPSGSHANEARRWSTATPEP